MFLFSDNHNPLLNRLHGGLGEMPNLEKLAAGGVTFDSAYCNYPLCVPSRGSMFAGRYASELGLWANAFTWNGQPAGWPHHMKQRGVYQAAIGKLHFEQGGDYGFDEELHTHHQNSTKRFDPFSLIRDKRAPAWEDNYLRSNWGSGPRDAAELPASMRAARTTTDLAVDWLRHNGQGADDWMLYVGYKRIHPPWHARPDLFAKYRSRMGDLPAKYLQPIEALHEVDRLLAEHTCGYHGSEERLKDIHASYYASMEEFDEELGRVLAAAADTVDGDDLCVIYSSDHGEMLRAHGKWGKLTLFEDATRVPLVIAHPQACQGSRYAHPVSLLDIMPTINAVTGGEPNSAFRGRSLLPAVLDANCGVLHPDGVVAEAHGNAWPCSGFALRLEHWKWVEYVGYSPALYDLSKDPQELDDLVKKHGGENHPAIRKTVARLRKTLRQHLHPEKLNEQAMADQIALRERLEREGRLHPLLERYKIPPSILQA